jgi:hypothetical protein
MKEFLSESIQSRMLLEKPEISKMFIDTKTAIRKAIESLANDSYDRQELETKMVQLEQASEASTSPDFSPKAAKMALMTVPMIIKGFAETFDPNTKLASLIRKGFDMSGIDIPPPVASLMALPINIVPFAPGPPIGPLGLLYLATSFLEPKERKRLSDLKRGKNLNKGANPETGTFAEGTLEEQAVAQQEAAIKTARDIVVRYEKIKIVLYKMCNLIEDEVNALTSYGTGQIGLPIKSNLDRKPLKNSELNVHGIEQLVGVQYWEKHIRLDLYDIPDHKSAGYNAVVNTAHPVRPFGYSHEQTAFNDERLDKPTSVQNNIERMIGFISNFWQDLEGNDSSGASSFKQSFHSKKFLNRIYDWLDKADNEFNDGKRVSEIFWESTTNADGKKFLVLIENIARTCYILRAGMIYTLYALEELSPYKFGFADSKMNELKEISGIDNAVLNPFEYDTSKEFDDVIARAKTHFSDFESGGYGYTFKFGAIDFENKTNIFENNIKEDILSPSKYHNLFNTTKSAGDYYKEIFGVHVQSLTYAKSYSESEVELPSQLQNLKEEYEIAKEALERFEE